MIDKKGMLTEKTKEHQKEEKLSLIEDKKKNLILDTVRLMAKRMELSASELFAHLPKYFVVPGTVEVEGEIYTTYGIGVLENEVMTECIEDVSTKLDEVKCLVSKCNKNKLTPIHLRDVVDDFLA